MRSENDVAPGGAVPPVGEPEFLTAEHPPVSAGDPIDPNAAIDPNGQGEPIDPHASVPSHSWDELPGEPRPSDRGSRAALLRKLRWMPGSLTGRLVAGVTSLVVALVLATGLGTYFALHSFLYNRLDQQVTPVVTTNATLIQSCFANPNPFRSRSSCPLNSGMPFRTPQTEWLTVLDPSGAVPSGVTIEPSQALQPMSLNSGESKTIVAAPTKLRTIRTKDGVTLRVSAVPIVGESGSLFVVSGLSTDEVARTLHRLVLLEWLIGAAAIAVAFVATTWGVRFSLRRLRTVTGTAHEVAAELSPDGAGLDRRVPLDETDATEVGQLAQSMNTLLAAVETQFAARLEREQQMRQFLADASHELRTPLTSIRGYAELARLRRAQSDGEPAEAAPAGAAADDNLDRIEAEGTRMSRLVDDLLVLARSDGGAVPRREWIEVSELLDESVGGVRAAFPGRRIDLSVPAGLHVLGDPDQLVRVVRNLVTNAAVHTRPDGAIGVSAVRDGQWLVLRIADQGPGLPADEAAHVFERFWRADKSRARARGGSGLGLPIVASLVQAHGGTVRFDSSVQTGSTVTVQLPLASA